MSKCSFLVWKDACLNYREFDLEGDPVGVPHTWYLSAQSFIRLLKLVWREYDIVSMNEWKKKCGGLQRTWVSKRTVLLIYNHNLRRHKGHFIVSTNHQCDVPVEASHQLSWGEDASSRGWFSDESHLIQWRNRWLVRCIVTELKLRRCR